MSTDTNSAPSGATWIGCPLESSRAPLLRREFDLDKRVASATLHICGLGYHDIYINGGRVGDHVLDPAQTDYEARVMYVSHDVTELIEEGDNCIGVMLGNGWYNQGRVWGDKGYSYGAPRVMAQLHIRFPDGSDRVVRADERWRCAPGPVTDNNVYAGERYDARLELPGWSSPGFDDSGWRQAVLVDAPGGRLEEQRMPPMRRIEELRPAGINTLEDGASIVDMGRNFSGWLRIRIDAPAGTEIRMRFAETLDDEGKLDTESTGVFATGVEQVDTYVCGGGAVGEWEPRFTYHGFRYVEITGWPGEVSAEDVTGVVVHTDLETSGSFECSDERLNLLHRMALRTHLSNCHGIPEDCPARERCGWLGDANMVAEFSMWNYDSREFWQKYLGDIETARSRNDGLPPCIAPGKRGGKGVANPDWAAAMILIPWYVYFQHGDPEILRRHHDGMTRLIEHFERVSKGWILAGGYGDWFDPGGDDICQHTPPTLTTTFWFLRCAEVMASCESVLGNGERSERYASWADRIRAAAVEEFYDPSAGSFGSQTADVMALHFGVVPEEERSRVVDHLVRDIREHDTHQVTGIMGVRYLYEVLSRNGQGDLALELAHRDTYPSFGDMISRGATTLWEWWGEAEIEEKHGARSRSHPMFGGYDNWFYNTLAGIRIDPATPGFEHFFLEPHPAPGLEWVRARHDCARGRIESNWVLGEGAFEWRVVVPEDSAATAVMPFTGEVRELGPGAHDLACEIGG